jgi:hypothetical protein
MGTSTFRRRIKAELAVGNLTADRESKVEEHRLAFVAKLRKFRELQAVYTPGAVRMMQKEEISRDPDLPAPSPEHIKLWLPSELPPAERTGSGCQRNVVDMEVTLREGQAENALVSIRGWLHCKHFLINFKNKNLTGQKKTTRVHTIIAQLGARIELTTRKYRDARAALTSLRGEEYAPHLKLLKASDITLEGEEARDSSEAAKSDREALKRMARVGGRSTQPLRSDASAKKAPGISWIWLANNGLDVSEEDLHDCKCFFSHVDWVCTLIANIALRVDWSRAKARKTRWDEEVELLREEMRRVLRYLEWDKSRWEKLRQDAAGRTDIAMDFRGGLEAYAAKQAALHAELYSLFRKEMGLPLDEATTSAIASTVDADALGELFTQGKASSFLSLTVTNGYM